MIFVHVLSRAALKAVSYPFDLRSGLLAFGLALLPVLDSGAQTISNLLVQTNLVLTSGTFSYGTVQVATNAVLTVSTGAVLNADQLLEGSNATLRVQSGQIICGGILNVERNGRLVLTNGASLVTQDLALTNGVTCTVEGGSVLNVGGTLSVASNAAVQCVGLNWNLGSNGVGVLIGAGNVLVAEGGKITADGLGYAGTSTTGLGNGYGGYYYSSASYQYGGGGGYGGRGGNSSSAYALGGSVYGDATAPAFLGSSGGRGGAGGGAIQLEVTNRLVVDGTITANGSGPSATGGGGGSGGSLWIHARLLDGKGRLQADGGAGSVSSYGSGGGGGGGRMAVYYSGGGFTNFDLCTVNGGSGYNAGAVGTALFFDTGASNLLVRTAHTIAAGLQTYSKLQLATNAVLTVNSGAVLNVEQLLVGSNAIVNLAGGQVACSTSVDVGRNGRLVLTNGASLVAQDLALTNGVTCTVEGGSVLNVGGTLSVASNAAVQCVGLNWNLGSNGVGVLIGAGNVLVAEGGKITADGLGYAGTSTTGLGNGYGGYYYSSASYQYGGGGGYGGRGGNSSSVNALGGNIYGDATAPAFLGSSGGRGGAGGGAIQLEVTNQLVVDGTITASGSGPSGTGGGGGSGGSLWIHARLLDGKGRMQADGGAGSVSTYGSGGGGGGGRMAVYYNGGGFTNFDLCTVNGGSGYNAGAVGTALFLDAGATNLLVRTAHTISAGLQTYSKLLLATNAVLTVNSGAVLNVGQLLGGSNAVVNVCGGQIACAGTVGVGPNGRLVLTNGASLAAQDLVLTNGVICTVEGGSLLNVGGTLSVASNAVVQCVGLNWNLGSNGVGVVIGASNVFVAEGGKITADGQGYGGELGLGKGGSITGVGGGGGYGGTGGSGYRTGYGSVSGGPVYGTAVAPVDLGSGGGSGGGAGGGAIRLEITNQLMLDGVISANGSTTVATYGGGGSGGSVYVRTRLLDGKGRLQADGGAGNSSFTGGGGGGRIAAYYEGGGFINFNLCTVNSGSGYNAGAVGTALFFDTGATNLLVRTSHAISAGLQTYSRVQLTTNAVLIVNSGAVLNVGQLLVGNNAVINIRSGQIACGGAVDVGPNGRLVLTNGASLAAQDLALTNGVICTVEGGSLLNVGGTLSVASNAVVQCVGLNWNLGSNGVGVAIGASNVLVAEGGKITADGQGYGGELGPGKGGSITGLGGGGGYGGTGGSGYRTGYGSVSGGPVYGTAAAPVELGSGGGYGGGAGGGAIRLEITNQLRLDGVISANGSTTVATYGGGGSGGSVYVRTRLLDGKGRLQADGGAGNSSFSGGGGGGRIAAYYEEGEFTNFDLCTVNGGSGYNAGTVGTRTWSSLSPRMIQPPLGQFVMAGAAVSLSVVAKGAPGLDYQWWQDNHVISGETNATLTLPGITLAQAGSYTVTISNQFNSVVSTPAVLTVVSLAGDAFRIVTLSSTHSRIVDHQTLTGGNRGSLALSSRHVFCSGDASTAGFALADLSGGAALSRVEDAMVSDLRSLTMYALADGTNRLGTNGGNLTALLELDPASAAWNGGLTYLSSPIAVGPGYGIFAGYGRVALHTGARVYDIVLPSGTVTDLGPMTMPVHRSTGSGTYWGVAEFFGGALCLAYVRDSQTIVRTRVPDGQTSVAAAFGNLADMASFSVAPYRGRWYFHHQGNSQFGAGSEVLGFADASFTSVEIPRPPVIFTQPADLNAPGGTDAVLDVGASGTLPLAYQWFLGGTPLVYGTNATLLLSNVQYAHAGDYSVVLSNSAGVVTSQVAQVTVYWLPPVITGPLSATAYQGRSFTNAITLSQGHATFGASGLPSGLMVNPTNGQISGIPTGYGAFGVTLYATNPGGSSLAQMQMTVSQRLAIEHSGGSFAMTNDYRSSPLIAALYSVYDWFDFRSLLQARQARPTAGSIRWEVEDRHGTAWARIILEGVTVFDEGFSGRGWLSKTINSSDLLDGQVEFYLAAYSLTNDPTGDGDPAGGVTGSYNYYQSILTVQLTETLDSFGTVADALDAPGTSWTGSGFGAYPQIDVTHDGTNAVVLGLIGNNQSTYLQTVVSGPGNLSFWWKVSSETNNDRLEFYVDSVRTNFISGETGWQQVQLALPAGSHTLKWSYTKDAGGIGGVDRGWLDQVSYISEAPPMVSSIAVGSNLQLTWPSVAGQRYQLQSATNLPAATWLEEGLPFDGTGSVLTTNIPIGLEPIKFFRLVLLER